jgi:hypothetical protein
MVQTRQMLGPHTFQAHAGGDPAANEVVALIFIAERMAGIEWLLAGVNEKLSGIQGSLSAIAHKNLQP